MYKSIVEVVFIIKEKLLTSCTKISLLINIRMNEKYVIDNNKYQ